MSLYKQNSRTQPNSNRGNDRGVILIVVLWIIVISLVMVTILASNVRLSVGTIFHQSDALQNKAKLMAAVNLAKMQILLNKSSTRIRAIQENNSNTFNTMPISMSYQYDTGMIVRIFDLSGLINIVRISRKNFKLLLEKQLALVESPIKIEDLLNAWQDWIDHDNLTRINGAEKNYYQQQVPPYQPRNAPLEMVEELKLIKGFADIFHDIDLNSVFSIYGKSSSINPNIAPKETLLLIPGITESLAKQIIEQRNITPFSKMSDFYMLFSADEINKIMHWFSLKKSNFFAITVYPEEFEETSSNDLYAYKELVQYKGLNQIPQTLMLYPMTKIKRYHLTEQNNNE